MDRIKNKMKRALFPSNPPTAPPSKKSPNAYNIDDIFDIMGKHIDRKGKKITIILDPESCDAIHPSEGPMTETPIPHITYFIDDHDDPSLEYESQSQKLLNEAAECAAKQFDMDLSGEEFLHRYRPVDGLREILIEEANSQWGGRCHNGKGLVVAEPPWRYAFCSKFKEMWENNRERDKDLAKSYLRRARKASSGRSGPVPTYQQVKKWGDKYAEYDEGLLLGTKVMNLMIEMGLLLGQSQEVRNKPRECSTTPARAHRRQRAGIQDDIATGNYHTTRAYPPRGQRPRIQDDIELRPYDPMTGWWNSNRAYAIADPWYFPSHTNPGIRPMYESYWTQDTSPDSIYYEHYEVW
ncbi:hypothetical protein FQN51_004646 [Onygenales sp. PD_10]|nr:hypothetical protein FQN51_004646 [Onygenales sp. PD_10]